MRHLIFAALLCALPGCAPTGAPQAGGKLAARVNGTAISLADGKAFSKEKLDGVIDQELFVQQALQLGLDRDPAVARKIDEARRQVLAQAWLDQAASRGDAGGRSAEVARFYAENPALFAQRRIYRFQEIVVSSPSGNPGANLDPSLDLVRAELSGARDLEEVAGWLKWRGLQVSPAAAVTLAAEQLPLSYLPQLSRMREGEIAALASPLGASVIRLLNVQEAPVTQAEAAGVIERFLAGRKRLELAAAEAKRLRQTASIEYAGEFKR